MDFLVETNMVYKNKKSRFRMENGKEAAAINRVHVS
jgi:hypothetical protein